MYFFAEERVGTIVKYIVQSVSRNEEELASESERPEKILVYPFTWRNVIKKEILFEFGRRIKKENEFCTNLNWSSFWMIFGDR